VLAGLLIAVLTLQTAQRAFIWSDEVRLTSYHLRHHPESPRSIYHYANTQLRLGEASTNDDERREYLARARRYYEHILEYRPQDVAALATLLYMDSRYFDLDSKARWKSELRAAVQKPVLSYADRNALYFLLRCTLADFCDIADQEFAELFTGLSDNNPENVAYLDILARFEGSKRQDYTAAIRLHERVLEIDPSNEAAFLGLVEWHSLAGRSGPALDVMRRFLASDGGVVSTLRVQRIFKTGEET
jgi:tetratricopeptide (TPR) repeat protein